MKIDKLKAFPYKLILASASPRRQQLLRDMGFGFSVQPLSTDEGSWPAELAGGEIPRHLAIKKAREFPRPLVAGELLITADTVVWREGRIYNKPRDFADAKAMLLSLSGGMHQVFTAVCLKSEKKERSFVGESKVYFKKLGEDEIDYYISNYKPFDKAGSYGVQDWLGYIGIEKIEGSFYNVMGLPVKEVYEELLNF